MGFQEGALPGPARHCGRLAGGLGSYHADFSVGRLASPKRVMQESKTEAAGSFMTQPWAAQVVVPAMSYWSHWVALFVVGGAYRDVNTRK